MTVSTQDSKINYPGNGVTTDFQIPYYFLENENIHIQKKLVNDIVVDLINGVDFTVSGAGDSAGGLATLTLAPLSGEIISIYRQVPLIQEIDYKENEIFPANTHEMALDKLTMEVQQVKEVADRSLQLSRFSDTDPALVLTEVERIYSSIDNVDTVANNLNVIAPIGEHITEIQTVGNNITNVNTVAGISENVTTVAENMDNIEFINEHITEVQAVGDNIESVINVNDNIEDINTVADMEDNITTIVSDKTNIDTVATNIESVESVGTNIDNVNTVADMEDNVNSVVSNATNINTVASNMASVSSVGQNIGSVVNVSNKLEDIAEVLEEKENITTVATNITNVVNVGSNIDKVTDVADDLETIGNVADNLEAIGDVHTNMSYVVGATTAAENAYQSETNAKASELSAAESEAGAREYYEKSQAVGNIIQITRQVTTEPVQTIVFTTACETKEFVSVFVDRVKVLPEEYTLANDKLSITLSQAVQPGHTILVEYLVGIPNTTIQWIMANLEQVILKNIDQSINSTKKFVKYTTDVKGLEVKQDTEVATITAKDTDNNSTSYISMNNSTGVMTLDGSSVCVPNVEAGDDTTKAANTAFVSSAVSTAVSTETTRATTAEALLAPKASPNLTGTPTAPTAPQDTNNTQVATTAFVKGNIQLVSSLPETQVAGVLYCIPA